MMQACDALLLWFLPLISSGYARAHPDEIPDAGRFVPKPYHAATIVRQIHELVHRAQR